ncbi:hypothetical protein TM902_120099 [Tenacibaculum maritimum]|uniref:hypothetical protein n=1 Tax=Tenacibaculum maritimum TaxID=107401 RepID=UPI0012E43AF8|nr:hypothetical protein [Tenacibaculum maritimum]MCD9582202.1 hypothetical protein [Tenacibaculum maritimum]MCD9636581.1 hypothetical protein [Tenacibaculum maritimum]CAA0143134.1 hypothetical protein TM902_120099 [Tenacibaculum maritimum]CAA0166915.1 hypothetical protein TMP139_170027 [Tenacibaculum maritimum]CAA0237805.1 hypothetical protein JIP32914_50109 [Tenacibaculum maritimum]
MFLINVLAKPKKETEQYGEVVGAYVSLYIDYKDIEGAIQLAKFYIKEEGWKVVKVEEEYFVLDSSEDVEEDQVPLYREALEDGYAIIFNCYEEE